MVDFASAKADAASLNHYLILTMSLTTDLDIAAIVHALGANACHFDVDLIDLCESTNSLLLARAETGVASGSVIVAQHQTAGRGRRGRAWISAPGDSLTFSLLWRLPPHVQVSGLSLAAGLAVVRAMDELLSVGADETSAKPETTMLQGGRAKDALCAVACDDTPSLMPTQLKWPNDIIVDGRKLGGILVELIPGATPGSNVAVIGCGINLRLPSTMPADLHVQSAALNLGATVNPNTVLAAILVALLNVLEQFTRGGFAALQTDWMQRDAFANQPVRVLSEFAPPINGICRGVNADGALRLEVDGSIQVLLSGEVSLRLAP